jgi:hypothetical protein
LILVVGALLAACGSSSSGSGSTAATTNTSSAAASTGSGPNSARGAALRKCLAQHGVTLPARPGGARRRPNGTPPAGGGLFGGGGGAGNRFANNPKLAAAFRACGGFAFRGGQRRFQISHATITKFVACVRAHGFAAMPSPNFSGKGPVLPASIRTNPKFLSASKACANLLVRPGAGAAPPSGTGSTASS